LIQLYEQNINWKLTIPSKNINQINQNGNQKSQLSS
jgi:hypothetical protein